MNIFDIQHLIAQYVFTNKETSSLKKILNANQVNESTERLAIYKNNTLHSLSESIVDLYPSIEHVVGRDFLIATAKEYLKTSPPHSAALLNFGLDFPEFIATFEHTKNYAYLPDLARIDMLRHQAYHAADETPLSLNQIQQIPLEELAQSYIQLPKSCYTLTSKFKTYSLWEKIHTQDDSEILIDGTEHTLIYRDNLYVKTIRISKEVYFFLEKIKNGCTLGNSLENTLKEHPDCNTSELFASLITYQLIIYVLKDFK